jgi:hypothetical protein
MAHYVVFLNEKYKFFHEGILLSLQSKNVASQLRFFFNNIFLPTVTQDVFLHLLFSCVSPQIAALRWDAGFNKTQLQHIGK